jgi:hypothetical protein
MVDNFVIPPQTRKAGEILGPRDWCSPDHPVLEFLKYTFMEKWGTLEAGTLYL